MLDISSKYTDIEVVGKFKDKLNVLWGESGSGKTFLFSKIKSYLPRRWSSLCRDTTQRF